MCSSDLFLVAREHPGQCIWYTVLSYISDVCSNSFIQHLVYYGNIFFEVCKNPGINRDVLDIYGYWEESPFNLSDGVEIRFGFHNSGNCGL